MKGHLLDIFGAVVTDDAVLDVPIVSFVIFQTKLVLDLVPLHLSAKKILNFESEETDRYQTVGDVWPAKKYLHHHFR